MNFDGRDMHRLKLMVDRELPDGRVVVINDSRENAPVGVLFTSLFAEDVERHGDDFIQKTAGTSVSVALRLESVEWFRKSIDVVPSGHNAAVRLSGEGLAALKAHLTARKDGRLVFLGSE
ncbi:MAG: hypothetical protein J7598_01955 [Mitsuaria chitosanitabida]|uniref:hypothetical protein n=1 Tax=Roseateles chitosanitabidus TaxID=65048 RepID=UPI001B2B4839|nr:hypothetical protein [Roseateles chitosanitabidus]MBO9685352.1 hypothetical protein [Roseateles chitosanitabidus]